MELCKLVILLFIFGIGILGLYYLTPSLVRAQDAKIASANLQTTYVYDRANVTTLQLVQVLFRHGARSPLTSFETDPNKDFDYGVKGAGQLTPIGRYLASELGTYLRHRYDGFLAKEYSYDQVFTQSSDTDRTIMTAQLCLDALFSPTLIGLNVKNQQKWQAVPVRSIPGPIDNKLIFGSKCPLEDLLFEKYKQSPTIQRIMTKSEWIFNLIPNKTGWQDVGFQSAIDLQDIFVVESENGAPLVPWSSKVYPEWLTTLTNLQYTWDTATLALKQLHIGPFFAELVQNMDLRVFGGLTGTSWTEADLRFYPNRTAKAYLYSGHDTTISPFLNSLDLYDGTPPQYTAAVMLELHSLEGNSKEEKDYFVKLFYKKVRNAPVIELPLPQCQSSCTLSRFKTVYQHLIVGDGDWKKACYSTDK